MFQLIIFMDLIHDIMILINNIGTYLNCSKILGEDVNEVVAGVW